MSAQGIGPKNQTCEQLPPAEPVTFVTQLLTLLGAAQFPQLGGGKNPSGVPDAVLPPQAALPPVSRGSHGDSWQFFRRGEHYNHPHEVLQTQPSRT